MLMTLVKDKATRANTTKNTNHLTWGHSALKGNLQVERPCQIRTSQMNSVQYIPRQMGGAREKGATTWQPLLMGTGPIVAPTVKLNSTRKSTHPSA